MPTEYTRLRVLGRGATAQVWLADGPDGIVALKVAHEPGLLRREIAVLRRVRHPAIARLIAADPNGNWMAMEHAPLGQCNDWATGQSLATLVDFGTSLAEGLAALHEEGIVHGDVKPANVLVGVDHRPRLVDLGSATPAGQPVGSGATPGYMAPERLKTEPATVATDIWGLGATLYTLLTRRAPFTAEDATAMVWAPLTTLPEPLSAVRPRIPHALDELVLQMLAQRPQSRPKSALSVAQALGEALRDAPRAPIVGMYKEREILRHAVVDVLQGGRSMFVVHGTAGSGRRALIREAVQACVREGLRLVPPGDRASILAAVSVGGPCVVALDGDAEGGESLLQQLILTDTPVLVLARVERPMLSLARRGARHLTPPRLSLEEATLLLEAMGYDANRAEVLHRRSAGLPGAIQGLLAPTPLAGLSASARKVLQHLHNGAVTVPGLAALLELREHQLLDLVEPMMDRGMVVASADGMWLSAVR